MQTNFDSSHLQSREVQEEEVIRHAEGTIDDPPLHPLLKAWFAILFWGVCLALSVFVLGSWIYQPERNVTSERSTSEPR